MSLYILTILKHNILDNCEAYDDKEFALLSAKETCRFLNIPIKDNIVFDSSIPGWVIADDYGYFVSVVERNIHFYPYSITSSYANMLDKISGGGRFSQFNNVTYFSGSLFNDSFYKELVSPVVPPALPPQGIQNHLAEDPNLPGGFNWNHKPLTMAEVLDSPDEVMHTQSLTELEKWALVTARLRHSPYSSFNIDKSIYSHESMIKELQDQTTVGFKIREEELDVLQKIYDQVNNSSDDYDDSSSEEESSY